MPVFQLDERLVFPPVEFAEPDGLLAVGGDLNPKRLLLAYSRGIFPWPHRGMPLMWFAPDPRMVLPLGDLHVSRSLRARRRKGVYEIRFDTAFREVMETCASVPRPDQDGTWITPGVVEAYCRLHALGLAHSVEAWRDDQLVGGLYGVSLGAAFFGESMFSRASDASKVAFVELVGRLASWGLRFVDCQIHSQHLASFGAREWTRAEYMRALEEALVHPTRQGCWTLGEGQGPRTARRRADRVPSRSSGGW